MGLIEILLLILQKNLIRSYKMTNLIFDPTYLSSLNTACEAAKWLC